MQRLREIRYHAIPLGCFFYPLMEKLLKQTTAGSLGETVRFTVGQNDYGRLEGGVTARRRRARGLYLQPYPLNEEDAKLQVSYFESGRYHAPSNLPR